jgi:exodeoxyribonuclease VII large subunit
MNPGFAFQSPREREKPYTVSELNAGVATLIESANTVVWVEAEISNCKQATSGHWYLTLKDGASQISAVIWRSNTARLKCVPANGMAVMVIASLRVYQKAGTYQLDIARMQPAGLGALHAAFEKLKQKLEAEGLFDPARKRPLPALVRRLGVITAKTGAALRDIVRVVASRAPGTEILLRSVAVQGQEAPGQIVQAIAAMNAHGAVDCIIVGRGGGSIEDLWAFNDEAVARAIRASAIPIISAVGHEIDFTIADFVADVRAATPSAAAEIAVADEQETRRYLESLAQRFATHIGYYFTTARGAFNSLVARPALAKPLRMTREYRQHCDELHDRFLRNGPLAFRQAKERQAQAAARLQALSPLGVLARGYSVVQRGDGALVRTSRDVATGDDVRIRFQDGRATARITGVETKE